MPQAVDNTNQALEQLSEQLRNLERRVAQLEELSETSAAKIEGASIALQRSRPPATWRGFPPIETPSGAVPILGKAVLGIAGAYLLRALAESNSIPKLPVLLVAILYAGFWLVWAARIHAASRFASTVYAVTSALILSPLLWEATVRFQVLAPAVAASITVGFVVLGIALAWREDLQVIPWVTTLASVITALALIIESHDLVPLTAALLVVALVTEAAACLGHRLTLRAIPALGADFAVWLLVFILASDNIPEGYNAVRPSTIVVLCLLLPAIYSASIGIRSFVLRQPMRVLEFGQVAMVYVLATSGILRATQGSMARPIGAGFLILAAACYWGVLWQFADDASTRNRCITAIWAAVLLVAGSYWLFPSNLQLPFLSAAAAVATLAYTRTRKLSLGAHASLYLGAAVAVSTVPAYAADALAADIPGMPDWRFWTVVTGAGVCYALGSRTGEAQRSRRMLWLIPAAIIVFSAAALAIVLIVRAVATRGELSSSSLPMIRTAVICVLALALGLLGSHLNRPELGWLAYAAVALGALKLFLEDLRFGNAASLVVSLLFYGLILILLPRLTKRSLAT